MTTREVHNQRQIRYFTDRPIERMELSSAIGRRYIVRQATEVAKAATLSAADRVLDVGCGPGRYTNVLHRLGFNVEGMDLTPRVVESLRASSPDIASHVGDLMDPPEQLRSSFDVIVGFFVLHHVHDLEAAFRGAASLLRDGGRVAFCEPSPYFLGYAAQIAFTPNMSFRGERGIVQMREGLMRRAVAGADLDDFAVQRFGLLPPALANHRLGAAFEDTAERLPGKGRYRAFQVFSARVRPAQP